MGIIVKIISNLLSWSMKPALDKFNADLQNAPRVLASNRELSLSLYNYYISLKRNPRYQPTLDIYDYGKGTNLDSLNVQDLQNFSEEELDMIDEFRIKLGYKKLTDSMRKKIVELRKISGKP